MLESFDVLNLSKDKMMANSISACDLGIYICCELTVHFKTYRWFLGYTCCDACGRLFVKGNYCPVCLKVYFIAILGKARTCGILFL